jgi:hypothetical protein
MNSMSFSTKNTMSKMYSFMITAFKINVAGFFPLKSSGWNVAKKKVKINKTMQNQGENIYFPNYWIYWIFHN